MNKMKNANLFVIRLLAMLALTAAAISIGSRRIESWKDGNLFTAGGLILFGMAAGWFLFFFTKRYLPAQSAKLYSLVGLSVLLGFMIWCFRPVLVSILWDSIKVEALDKKTINRRDMKSDSFRLSKV
jgi:drug/metabolite transporter (DMT)-like permease